MFVLLLGLSPSVGSFQQAGWPSSFLWHVKLLLSGSQMMSFLLLTCGRPDVSRSSLQFLSGHVTLSLCRDDSLTFTGRSSLCSVAFYQDFIVFLKVVKFTNELDRHTAGDEAEDLWITLGWLWVFSYFCASKCIPAVSEGSEAERPTASCGQWSGCSFIDGEVRGQMHTSRCLWALKNQSCKQWWCDPCTSAHFKSAVELVFGNTSKSCPLMKTLSAIQQLIKSFKETKDSMKKGPWRWYTGLYPSFRSPDSLAHTSVPVIGPWTEICTAAASVEHSDNN